MGLWLVESKLVNEGPGFLKACDSLGERDGNHAPFLTPSPCSEPVPVRPGNWVRQIKYTKPSLCLTVLSNVPSPPLDSWVLSDEWGLFGHEPLPLAFESMGDQEGQQMGHFHREGWGWAVLGAACPRHLAVLGPSNPLCWTTTMVSFPLPNLKEGQKVFAPIYSLLR